MQNRLYKYLLDSNILYKKQFDCEEEHLTNHAIVQLIDQMYKNFEQNNFTLRVFIDLSKAFHIVDQNMLVKKLPIHGIDGKNTK